MSLHFYFQRFSIDVVKIKAERCFLCFIKSSSNRILYATLDWLDFLIQVCFLKELLIKHIERKRKNEIHFDEELIMCKIYEITKSISVLFSQRLLIIYQ